MVTKTGRRRTMTYFAENFRLGLLALLLWGNNSRAAEIEWRTVRLAGQDFRVEVVRTPEAQAQGLMYRTHLAPNHGMLFIHATVRPVAFWMKNTLIPLDILFFDAQQRLLKAYVDVPPCKTATCPHYVSPSPAQYILELPAKTVQGLALDSQFELQ